jgi:hypothetical protein
VSADLIFLDLGMPGMTGLEFLKELRTKETLSQTPVIVLCGLPMSFPALFIFECIKDPQTLMGLIAGQTNTFLFFGFCFLLADGFDLADIFGANRAGGSL